MIKISRTTLIAFIAAWITNEAVAFSPMQFPQQPKAAATSTQLYEYGASSTSFYTTTEKQSSYAGSDEMLAKKCRDPKVRQVINDMLDACAEITDALRTSLVTVEGTENDFGDTQLSVDVSKVLYSNVIKGSPLSNFQSGILFSLGNVNVHR